MKLYVNLCISAHFFRRELLVSIRSQELRLRPGQSFHFQSETKHLFLLLRPLKLDGPTTEQVKNDSEELLVKTVLTSPDSC